MADKSKNGRSPIIIMQSIETLPVPLDKVGLELSDDFKGCDAETMVEAWQLRRIADQRSRKKKKRSNRGIITEDPLYKV
jgi:hypothetical protein